MGSLLVVNSNPGTQASSGLGYANRAPPHVPVHCKSRIETLKRNYTTLSGPGTYVYRPKSGAPCDRILDSLSFGWRMLVVQAQL